MLNIIRFILSVLLSVVYTFLVCFANLLGLFSFDEATKDSHTFLDLLWKERR